MLLASGNSAELTGIIGVTIMFMPTLVVVTGFIAKMNRDINKNVEDINKNIKLQQDMLGDLSNIYNVVNEKISLLCYR